MYSAKLKIYVSTQQSLLSQRERGDFHAREKDEILLKCCTFGSK